MAEELHDRVRAVERPSDIALAQIHGSRLATLLPVSRVLGFGPNIELCDAMHEFRVGGVVERSPEHFVTPLFKEPMVLFCLLPPIGRFLRWQQATWSNRQCHTP